MGIIEKHMNIMNIMGMMGPMPRVVFSLYIESMQESYTKGIEATHWGWSFLDIESMQEGYTKEIEATHWGWSFLDIESIQEGSAKERPPIWGGCSLYI